MRLALLALVGLLGCDQVFGLDRPAAPIPIAQPCRGPGEKIVLPLLADTYLDPADESPRGDSSVVRVGDGRTALLRFAGTSTINELSVTLTNASTAQDCGAGSTCASCAPGTAGELVMHLMRPDWDEASATQTQRTETEPWTTPGATGTDRSNPLCTVGMFDGFDVACRFMFLPTDLGADWPADLSVQIRAMTTATGVFGSREGVDECARTPVARAIATCRGTATCGNKILDTGEGCDDGNTTSGDGCTAGCAVETLTPICGNHTLEVDEECDDGNLTPGDGCGLDCKIEPLCGNHVVEAGEQCDDGNSQDDDGCSNGCRSCQGAQCGPV